jgi:hypothetical protein
VASKEYTMATLHVVTRTPEQTARALMKGKPVRYELRALCARVLREYVADMAKTHADLPSNVVPLPRR